MIIELYTHDDTFIGTADLSLGNDGAPDILIYDGRLFIFDMQNECGVVSYVEATVVTVPREGLSIPCVGGQWRMPGGTP